jgi:hypothetical protein
MKVSERLERIGTVERTLNCVYTELTKSQRFKLDDVINEAFENLIAMSEGKSTGMEVHYNNRNKRTMNKTSNFNF